MQRDFEFSYQCRRCSRCCPHQATQVNPYETLRLARHLGMGTSQFIAWHTTNSGLLLRFNPEGACGFLGAHGCGVHPARHLVCRLYPLGREIDLEQGESFVLLERHEQCSAVVGRHGQLSDYLAEQSAGPFLEAADLYLEVVLQMQQTLLSHGSAGSESLPTGLAGREQAGEANPWLDVGGVC